MSFASNVALSSVSSAVDIVAIYIPIITAVKSLVKEIYQIYEDAEFNSEICLIMKNRVIKAECSVDSIIKDSNNEKKLREQSYYLAFKSFENVLIKIRDFVRNVSKLKGYKKYLNATEVKNKYMQLTEEFDTCMADLHFAIDVANKSEREEEAKKVDKALDNVEKNLEKLDDKVTSVDDKVTSMYENVNTIMNSIELLHTKSDVHAKEINPADLYDPVSRIKNDIRGQVFRKVINHVADVACKPIKDSSHYQTELAILGKLSKSPYILHFYGLSRADTGDGNREIMVFEWAYHGTLTELYDKFDIPWTRKIQITRDICRGIIFLRWANIFHHDLRCDNIFVTQNLDVKLGNFKYSRAVNANTSNISDLIKHIRWMAPEQIEKYTKASKKGYTLFCELFSFGMLIWELCYERYPYSSRGWDNDLVKKVSEHILSGKREDLCVGKFIDPIDKEIQLEFIKIISEAWRHEPNQRIDIMKLNTILDDMSVKYPIPPNLPLLLNDKTYDFDGKKESKQTITDTSSSLPKFDDDFEIIDFNDPSDFLVPLTKGIEYHKNKDHKSAWDCFKQHANLGDPLAKYWQGYYYYNGYVVEKDLSQAKKLFKEAADDNHPESQYRYAVMQLHSLKSTDDEATKKKNCNEIVHYLKLAADNMNIDAMFYLGDIYMNGKLRTKQNKEIGLEYLKLAAKNNSERAINMLKQLNLN
ncbi:23271_t:CDS:2 [Gigaspora margarita]|uniref:23271_t:CDS:1 n=1 Tax=Gigaspora margarita TaxID=4874 RepID=A0ABN7VH28_GIGMA|nr:23271_t:CDS:2 [Gigaspora margarita]